MNAPLFWSIAWPVTPTRVVGEEPCDGAGDLARVAHPAERHLLLRDLPRLLLRQPFEQREPEPGHVGVDPAGADRVHLDPRAARARPRTRARARAGRPSTRSTPVYPATPMRERIDDVTRSVRRPRAAAPRRARTSTCRRGSSAGSRRSGRSRPARSPPPMPAFATSASSGSVNAAKTASRSLMSTTRIVAPSGAARRGRAASAARPRTASRSAIASPIPRAAPVTATCFPSKRFTQASLRARRAAKIVQRARRR